MLSHQLVADALVRKSSVTDANASYVQKLRVVENATNEEIQAALHELFKNGPQGELATSSIQDVTTYAVYTVQMLPLSMFAKIALRQLCARTHDQAQETHRTIKLAYKSDPGERQLHYAD